MDARRAVALLVLVMGVLRVAPAGAADGPGGYIYDAVARGSNLSIVINVQGDIAGIQDKRDADPSVESGEFSGPIGDCSDVTFFCIDGPLLIRVPRDLGLTGWSYRGVSCLARELRPGVLRYSCHTKFYGRRVEYAYIYSSSRGVLSFQDMPLLARGWFRLRGREGIFSSGPLGCLGNKGQSAL